MATHESVVPAGKHKSKTFGAVEREDPSYCLFAAMTLSGGEGPLSEFGDWCRAKVDALDGNNVVAFGKHRGKTYTQLLEIDPEYCSYLVTLGAAMRSAEGSHLIQWLAGKL